MDKSILPVDFGGLDGDFDNSRCREAVEEMAEYFEAVRKYRKL